MTRRGTKRLWTAAHARVYRASRGRFLARVGGQPVLLLQTLGRRTGRLRTTPVQYLRDDGKFVVVAANGGALRPPAWYFNLLAEPRARVLVGGTDVDVVAREAAGPERAELWRRLTAANRFLERVARKAGRPLPVVVLTPAPGGR
jgi:deazaflavin-dependent oxidoreductase (nitroreductase family)